jgi:hypothetical protein
MSLNLSDKKINKFFTIKKISASFVENKLNRLPNLKLLNNTEKPDTISGIIFIMLHLFFKKIKLMTPESSHISEINSQPCKSNGTLPRKKKTKKKLKIPLKKRIIQNIKSQYFIRLNKKNKIYLRENSF